MGSEMCIRDRNMLYSGFNVLPRSVVRRQTRFAARITRTLCCSLQRTMPLPSFKLRTLFIFTAIVCCAFAADQIYERWHREKYSFFEHQQILSQIKEGDSLDHLSNSFEEFMPSYTVGEDFTLVPMADWGTKEIFNVPDSWETDSEIGDVFCVGFSHGEFAFLTFRNGLLFGWHETDASEVTALFREPVPNPIQRYLVAPSVMLALLSMWAILSYTKSYRNSNAIIAT